VDGLGGEKGKEGRRDEREERREEMTKGYQLRFLYHFKYMNISHNIINPNSMC
jgi:hypothetical protein